MKKNGDVGRHFYRFDDRRLVHIRSAASTPPLGSYLRCQKKSKQPRPTPDCRTMYQLAEHYSEASSLLAEQAEGKQWGCSAPQLLVDSFAVELYLKCLFVLDTNTAPIGDHDWQRLFDALTPHTKTIREAFERIVRADPVLSHLSVINPEAVKVTDFDRSLAAAKNTFDRRRYLYEEEPPKGEWLLCTSSQRCNSRGY